jgi:predicted nucleic acid-binding protein
MRNRFSGEYRIIGSFVVVTEIIQNPDTKERRIIERLYNRITSGEAPRTAQRRTRAAELETKGLKTMDAQHLAAAEAADADYLLTVDKDFIKKASQPNFTTVKVINPIDF